MVKRKSHKKVKPAANEPARYSFDALDRVFHEKARLGILTSMVSSTDELNFTDLKELCGLTDGNLNRHLKVLLEAKIIAVRKTGRGRNTNSDYRLTAAGRRAFLEYIAQLEDVVRKAQAIESKSNDRFKLAPE